MQRIANLLVVKDNQVLLLKKPRRDWYVAPGGKMDSGESIYEAAIREFEEETGATPVNPQVKGIYTMMILNPDTKELIDEWMLYTFVAKDLIGTPYESNREGLLEWHGIEKLKTLPMAEGDRSNLSFAVSKNGVQYGTFYYTEEFELLEERLQNSMEGDLL
ncbi:8-oxo-dGTP diphosphatase [Sporosarcina thermotolerans]|uniref:8-oxo-dGTP diphosphatase n=1 Tax=Sporosarcina thermotolerans TaxID=633404 RepID=A0AAW9AFI6_9BACL|nr:8-oxo-dGTP diphosphatase [Sporosarcina thermotolerans]MDW0118408.1 8-oxo-dGTP diphosphatase [Sporosarcina thermotolerans]WHT49456.1 8-oxo-dGTP diphosphatase [Sporosarcina thermotolerans]